MINGSINLEICPCHSILLKEEGQQLECRVACIQIVCSTVPVSKEYDGRRRYDDKHTRFYSVTTNYHNITLETSAILILEYHPLHSFKSRRHPPSNAIRPYLYSSFQRFTFPGKNTITAQMETLLFSKITKEKEMETKKERYKRMRGRNTRCSISIRKYGGRLRKP